MAEKSVQALAEGKIDYSKIRRLKVPGTEFTFGDVLKGPRMSDLLSRLGYSKEDTLKIISKNFLQIYSDLHCIIKKKKLEFSRNSSNRWVAFCVVGNALTTEYYKSIDSLNFSGRDLTALIELESKFNPRAGYVKKYMDTKYTDLGLFQINGITCDDVFGYGRASINDFCSVIGVKPIFPENKDLLDPVTNMMLYPLILIRKYMIALGESREVGKNSERTNSYMYSDTVYVKIKQKNGKTKIIKKLRYPIKKKNLWYKKEDPRKAGEYALDSEQKADFATYYINASAKILKKGKNYGKEYLKKVAILESTHDKIFGRKPVLSWEKTTHDEIKPKFILAKNQKTPKKINANVTAGAIFAKTSQPSGETKNLFSKSNYPHMFEAKIDGKLKSEGKTAMDKYSFNPTERACLRSCMINLYFRAIQTRGMRLEDKKPMPTKTKYVEEYLFARAIGYEFGFKDGLDVYVKMASDYMDNEWTPDKMTRYFLVSLKGYLKLRDKGGKIPKTYAIIGDIYNHFTIHLDAGEKKIIEKKLLNSSSSVVISR
ncbi:MAG: hypothetical protein ABIH83_04475 [Candidatus Micrarchaeota archaeon]